MKIDKGYTFKKKKKKTYVQQALARKRYENFRPTFRGNKLNTEERKASKKQILILHSHTIFRTSNILTQTTISKGEIERNYEKLIGNVKKIHPSNMSLSFE